MSKLKDTAVEFFSEYALEDVQNFLWDLARNAMGSEAPMGAFPANHDGLLQGFAEYAGNYHRKVQ